MRVLTTAAIAQTIVYVTTGLWPLVHMDSFLWVTGPKVDLWLVRCVGLLVLVIGAVVGLAAWHRRLTQEIVLLAVGAATALASIDIYYVAVGRIRWVYLVDAVFELAVAAAWLLACRTGTPLSSSE